MKRSRLVPVVAILVVAGAVSNAQSSRAEADAALGVWVTEESKAHVEIYRCGEQYCGKIVWLKEPIKEGKVVLDAKNPDPKLRELPVLGMVLMHDFTYDGDGEYVGGRIYDAESGDTYAAKMQYVNDTTLTLRGYVLIPLFGRTTAWVRFRGPQEDSAEGVQKR
jgi:uncharacterized protein (DUF2147 family)